MKKKVGWSTLATLFVVLYIPPASNPDLWAWEVVGIPFQAILWLTAPIAAIVCVAAILPKPEEGAKR